MNLLTNVHVLLKEERDGFQGGRREGEKKKSVLITE